MKMKEKKKLRLNALLQPRFRLLLLNQSVRLWLTFTFRWLFSFLFISLYFIICPLPPCLCVNSWYYYTFALLYRCVCVCVCTGPFSFGWLSNRDHCFFSILFTISLFPSPFFSLSSSSSPSSSLILICCSLWTFEYFRCHLLFPASIGFNLIIVTFLSERFCRLRLRLQLQLTITELCGRERERDFRDFYPMMKGKTRGREKLVWWSWGNIECKID